MPTSAATSAADMNAAARFFFTSPRYAVAGASSDPAKYGYKIFAWYNQHSLPVTPLNPAHPTVTIASTTHRTYPSPSSLPSSAQTSLSIVTPPSATLKILQEAKEAGVRAVWMQPGSFDDEGLALAKRLWPGGAVAGMEGLGGRGQMRAWEGWCVLVHGEESMEGVEREGGAVVVGGGGEKL